MGKNLKITFHIHIALPLDSDDDVSENVQSSCTGSAAETKTVALLRMVLKKGKRAMLRSLWMLFSRNCKKIQKMTF